MPTCSLKVSGLRCAGCVGHVEKALLAVPGVREARVNLALGQAEVELASDSEASRAALIDAVTRSGYRAQPIKPLASVPAAEKATEADHPAWRARAVVGLVAAAACMGLMSRHDAASLAAQALIASVTQVYVGWPFLRGAWAAWRRGTPDMDTLVTLGSSAAFLWSLATLARPDITGDAGHALYFETSTGILGLIALGKAMEERARRDASAAMRELASLQPEHAWRLTPQGVQRTAVSELTVGERVRVLPGERVPVDGLVEAGASSLDRSLVTGESVPVEVGPGDEAAAGCLNHQGSFDLRVTRMAGDTLLAQSLELVRRAQMSKGLMQRLADRVSGRFVPVVLVIAGAAGLGWWVSGDAARAVFAAVAVLVVACPCAMGLAVPTAVMVGASLGARRGILIRDIAAIERAGTITHVLLDKTGTLTRGTPRVVEWKPLGERAEARDGLRLIAAVQSRSEHPYARAMVAFAEEQGVRADASVESFLAEAGRGVSALVEGVQVRIGSPAWLDPDGLFPADTDRTLVLAEIQGKLQGWFALADEPRPGVNAAIDRLKAMGIEPMLLTGDRLAVAQPLARALGLSRVLAEALPAQKQREVIRLQSEGARVAMVGDGINDAPALAAADLGIAMGAGPRAAAEAGHLVLVGDDLANLPRAIALSRAMLRRVRAGLFWAAAYNLLLIPPAAAGMLHPALAAGAMGLSSVCVVLNALALHRTWRPD
jgi:Cu+-exporting ATPase